MAFFTQEERGSRFMLNALLSWYRCPDYGACIEVQLRALYRQMQEDFYDRALSIVNHRAGGGGGAQK